MRLPVRVFWFMHYQLTRMAADADLRALRMGLTVKHPTPDSVREFEQRLLLELGDVFKLDGVDLAASAAPPPDSLDRAGLNELRMML